MEDNLYDDKLDDYVRKSFEGYEEEPSADMWDRVEGDLLPLAAAPAPRLLYRRFGWQALAAVVILVLFSTLVCEHLYYEGKLRALTAKPAGEQESLPKNESTENASDKQVQQNSDSQHPLSGFLSTGLEEDAPTLPNALGDNAKRDDVPRNSIPGVGTGTLFQQFSAPNTPRTELRGTFPDRFTEDAKRGENGFNATRIETPDNEHNLVDQNFETSQTPQNHAKPSNLPTLKLTNLQTFKPPNLQTFKPPNFLSFQTLKPFPIKPVRKPSDWYLGVQTSLLANKEKSHVPISRPGRPAFVSTEEGSNVSAICWLKAGKKLNNRFSLESGIGYQKTTRTATHAPKFMFRDGNPHWPPVGTRRIYNYDLSTYVGTIEVSLRMEQTDPGVIPSDSEPVTLKITTAERAEMLRIPLLAAYRFGSGRLQWQLKAGLLGNFLLKKELDISARVSENALFRPVAGSDGYTIRSSQGKFFLGYALSAGAEFKLSKHFSLVAESVLAGDFPRSDDYSRRLPERYLLGLNAGVNFYF